MQKRNCVYCNKEFIPKSPHHLFCTTSHTNQYNKTKDWNGYFKRLLGNNAKERRGLSTGDLLELFERQRGLCALSGVELTKIAGKGQVATNASIDRIRAGGKYTIGNIRLVSNFVNSFRGNLTDKELFWWCKKIVKHNGRKRL